MPSVPSHAPVAVTTRGGRVECVHYGSIAVVDRDGKLVAAVGDPRSLNFTRSSLKPLQAHAFIQDGGAAKFGLTSREIAIMCASHGGEPIHLEAVQRILDRIGATERDLQCGCHPPTYYKATGKTPPVDGRWTQLHHNCSGKHSGFLAFCRLHGLPLGNYLDPGSPLQERVRDSVREVAHPSETAIGIDGCSAPNYAMPLASLAHAYCRLALGETPELAVLGGAMREHPQLVSGTMRLDLALMAMGQGDWVSKSGADGMQAVGIRSRGLGIAVRCADASARGVRTALVHVLQSLDLMGDIAGTPLEPLVEREIRNYKGMLVGQVSPAFEFHKR